MSAKKKIFEGAGVAIVTPFNEDLSINYDKLGELIEYQIANSTDAIVVCGTTGEAATLTDKEHRDLIKFSIDKVAGRIPVIAGTGSNDTYYSLELSQYAKEVGADALLHVTPYYNKTTQAGLVAHFNYIAERVDLPIILYNVPSRTGLTIKPETCKILSETPNIVAIKEASGDMTAVAKIQYLCGDNLHIYSGNDDQVVPVLSLGGIGVISVLSNIMPKETHDMCRYWLDGDIKESTKIQIALQDLIESLFCEVNPIPVKAAMKYMGMDNGLLRLPLTEITNAGSEKLKSSLKKVGLL